MNKPRGNSSRQLAKQMDRFPVAKDGNPLVLAPALVTKGLPGESGDVALVIPRIMRDTTERVRARKIRHESEQTDREREQLLDRERTSHVELAEVGRRKDEFLAMLGHELRNPLSGIVSAIHVLEQLTCQDPVAVEMHGVIKRQSLHMTRLIDDLLDVSRIACGKILLQMGRLDLVALTRDAVVDQQHHLEANQLSLDLELPSAPIWVVGDAIRLSQVITNLLHNATKFTDPGGTISVCVNRSGTSAAFSVRDTGIGMEPTDVAAMFEPFRQAESSRVRSKGGLGLGLALSKRLIEKHGGAITAASEGVGCGSVFSIRLPLDPEPMPEA